MTETGTERVNLRGIHTGDVEGSLSLGVWQIMGPAGDSPEAGQAGTFALGV